MKEFYEKIQGELSVYDATLIAVSKKQPLSKIEEAKHLGITNFGENYIQEALGKIESGVFKGCILHFIGHLQTNKSKEAVKHFDYIHSVDRLKLIKSLNKEASLIEKKQNIFLHVKTHEDENKSGCSTDEVSTLVDYIKNECSHLNLCGLMCIPPLNIDPELSFKELSRLKKVYNLSFISMGMSSDYQKALKNGATHIRVGTALFGSR